MWLYYIRAYSLCTHFVESFYDKWILNLIKCFFRICWDSHMIFNLQLVDVEYHTYLWILNHTYIPDINLTWLRCMILLIYCLIQFADTLLRIFASMFIRDIGLWLSFFVLSLVLVSYWTHMMNLEVSFLQMFGIGWEGQALTPPLNV